MKTKKEEFQRDYSYKYQVLLDRLYNKFTLNPNNTADNLISILENKFLLFNCYETLKSNQGLLTKGTDQSTADAMSMERIEKLATQMKNKTFQFKPARRI